MITDEEIAFLCARLDEDEATARAVQSALDAGWNYFDETPTELIDPARVFREVAVWRRLLLDYQTAPLDGTYGGTERETGFRLALSAALKAKVATYENNPVTGEPFPALTAKDEGL
jgi:Family of unknown function (DUF6221)